MIELEIPYGAATALSLASKDPGICGVLLAWSEKTQQIGVSNGKWAVLQPCRVPGDLGATCIKIPSDKAATVSVAKLKKNVLQVATTCALPKVSVLHVTKKATKVAATFDLFDFIKFDQFIETCGFDEEPKAVPLDDNVDVNIAHMADVTAVMFAALTDIAPDAYTARITGMNMRPVKDRLYLECSKFEFQFRAVLMGLLR